MSSILNRYFPHIFYINLEHRTDRRQQMEAQLDKLGIKATRRIAVKGNPWGFTKGLKPAEIGCIVSHLQIIELAQLMKLDSVLILEDDALINPGIDFYFSERYKLVPNNWQQLYLGSNHNEISWTRKRDHLINKFVMKCNWSLTTSAYALKSSAYSVIINKIKGKNDNWAENINKQLDIMYAELQDNNQIKAYSFYPALVSQRKSYSDIQEKIVSYEDCIK